MEIARERDSHPVDSKEYKEKQIAYKSIKGVVNSLYGYCGDKRVRLYNKDIARAITRIPKQMVLYCIEKTKELGINVIYADTDGIIFDTSENITPMLNAFIRTWAKEKFGENKEINTTFDYEGKYTDLLILKKCRYHGYLQHANGETEEKKVGIEVKRKDSSVFIKKFQKILIEKIHKDETQQDISKWITKQKELIKKEPIKNIAFPCSLSKPIAEYKTRSVWVKSYQYTHEKYDYNLEVGQRYYYVYVESEEREEVEKEQMYIDDSRFTNSKLKPYWQEKYKEDVLVKNMNEEKRFELIQELEKKGIIAYRFIKVKGDLKVTIAFDDKHSKHMDLEKINWRKMIEKNIDNKAKVVFEAMKWEYNI